MHRKLPIFYLILSFSALTVLPFNEELRDPVVVLDPSSQNTFRFKAFGDTFLAQLDPIHPDATVFVSEQLFDGLVTLDADLNPSSALPPPKTLFASVGFCMSLTFSAGPAPGAPASTSSQTTDTSGGTSSGLG